MPRNHRPHLPGHVFHITSRTQGQAHWFDDDIKARIESIIKEGVASAGARLFSHAVMSDHIHVVLVQGSSSLGWTMQPILRRISRLVQRTHKVRDHVFGARYHSTLCRDTQQLRNTIRYVHRNPVAAGICRSATDYMWSSARVWAGMEPCGTIAVEEALRAYTCASGTLEDMRAIYIESLEPQLSESLVERSDRSPLRMIERSAAQVSLPDMHDVVRRFLRSMQPGLRLEIVRSRYGGRQYIDARHQLIATLIQRGYSGVAIAKYLCISPATVSSIRSRMRWSKLPGSEASENGRNGQN